MSLFLSLVSVDEAKRRASSLAVPGGTEVVPLMEARGRVLAADVVSDIDIPGFSRSVVDGYALRAADTTGAGDTMPAMLAGGTPVRMGEEGGPPVTPGHCRYIPTGGHLPEGADAAVMAEYCEGAGDLVLVRRPVAPGENIVLCGEDFPSGKGVLPRGHRISSRDLGVLAATGNAQVPVYMVPRVGILSTGNELVSPDIVPGPGQVRDANSYLCIGAVQDAGCTPVPFGIVRDDRESLRAALARASETCDAVLVSGGSSKDDRDMSADVIAGLGEVYVHGVALAPGKPTIIGRTGRTPVIGLPGHPASAYVVMQVIGRALLAGLCGETMSCPQTSRAVMVANVPSIRGREEYIRVVIRDGMAVPLFGKSGLLNTLLESSGLVRIPAGLEGLEKGQEVEVIFW